MKKKKIVKDLEEIKLFLTYVNYYRKDNPFKEREYLKKLEHNLLELISDIKEDLSKGGKLS